MVLKTLVKGLVAQFLAYGVLGLGFWLLLQGFVRPTPGLGVLGGALILGGMYLLVTVRRRAASNPPDASLGGKEEDLSDPVDGSHQGDKLPP
jgi:multisubunit Na+/H+ antiporter MnhB subunit